MFPFAEIKSNAVAVSQVSNETLFLIGVHEVMFVVFLAKVAEVLGPELVLILGRSGILEAVVEVLPRLEGVIDEDGHDKCERRQKWRGLKARCN